MLCVCVREREAENELEQELRHKTFLEIKI